MTIRDVALLAAGVICGTSFGFWLASLFDAGKRADAAAERVANQCANQVIPIRRAQPRRKL
jgi:hypothetical protein